MTEHIKQIAERIRSLRELSGISAETLAHELGIEQGLYLDYESGNADIPVSFLYKTAHRFSVELSVLLSGENPRLHIYCVVRKGKGLSVDRSDQYNYENLAFNFIDKKAEPFLVTVDPKPENEKLQFNSHPGQEFHYMLEGAMIVIIDGHEIELNEGDSIYFNSTYNHAMKATNDKPARFLAIVI